MKRKRKSKPFVQIFNEMLGSKAYKQLSHAAFRAYVHIRSKYNGNNGNDLSYTYQEAAEIMDRHTYAKALLQLTALGFLDLVRGGRLEKQCNIFALSERWRDYGTPQFKEGNKWPRYSPHRKSKTFIGVKNNTCTSVKSNTCEHQNDNFQV